MKKKIPVKDQCRIFTYYDKSCVVTPFTSDKYLSLYHLSALGINHAIEIAKRAFIGNYENYIPIIRRIKLDNGNYDFLRIVVSPDRKNGNKNLLDRFVDIPLDNNDDHIMFGNIDPDHSLTFIEPLRYHMISIIDYLRANNYAFHALDYSVDEQVTAGLIKLKYRSNKRLENLPIILETK